MNETSILIDIRLSVTSFRSGSTDYKGTQESFCGTVRVLVVTQVYT